MKNKTLSSKDFMHHADDTVTQPQSFAEVIESSLDSFTAQSWQWDYFPHFGSLVYVESQKHLLLGCVIQVQTGSMDATRSAVPYQKTEAELRAEQPQIFEFLKTSFIVQIVGYTEKPVSHQSPTFFYLLPPTPTKIHTFVYECPSTLSNQFFASPDFLHLLFSFGQKMPNLDELFLAILQRLNKQQPLTQNFLDAFCQNFSLLTNNDYRRLKLFLKRIEALL
jgi:hypothetical protein